MKLQNSLSFMNATGSIGYNLANNYMFRYILQVHQNVLKGLICALLHLQAEQISSIEILNPIDLSGNVSGKEFILDIKIMLNDNQLVNLEMQNINEYNWPERSLSYLCRSFDHLNQGQDYEEALPVHHIGFLGFTLHPDSPEFYATYQMLNIKNHLLYSDKFSLSVVNLNYINLATEEDKHYRIDYWASLFKATTWEDLKMLTKDNEFLQEAVQSLYVANADEIVRQQCIARADAERRERTLVRDNNRLKQQLTQLQQEHSDQAVALAEKISALAEKDSVLAEKDSALAEKNSALAEKDREIAELNATIALLNAAQPNTP